MGPCVPAIENLGVVIHHTETHGKSIGAIGKLAIDVFRLLRQNRFDCVHVQMARPVPVIAVANYLAGKPSKIIWHSRGLYAGTYRFVPRLFETLGVRCIANCRSERDKPIRHGYKPHHVGYLYNLCELENVTLPQTDLKDQLRIPPQAVVIGSLSRLAKDRGVNYAIGLFLQVGEPMERSSSDIPAYWWRWTGKRRPGGNGAYMHRR